MKNKFWKQFTLNKSIVRKHIWKKTKTILEKSILKKSTFEKKKHVEKNKTFWEILQGQKICWTCEPQGMNLTTPALVGIIFWAVLSWRRLTNLYWKKTCALLSDCRTRLNASPKGPQIRTRGWWQTYYFNSPAWGSGASWSWAYTSVASTPSALRRGPRPWGRPWMLPRRNACTQAALAWA